jgi:diguanylate cyclase (GGDEF)-like protein/PAS domain S-box-containing protein
MPDAPSAILLVEDDPASAELAIELLGDALGVSVTHVDTLARAEATLARDGADCVLLDLSLPDSRDIVSVARLLAIRPETTIVVMTGRDDDATAREALRLGAQDYVVKSSDLSATLVRSVTYALERTRHRLALTVAEGHAHAAEEQFRWAFDHALIGMMIIDVDGCYTRVNDAFCRLVGYRRETLIGLSYQQLTDPADIGIGADSLPGLLSGEMSAYTWEQRYIHAAGHSVWASIGVTLMHNADGQPAHFIGQAQDVTERRHYEGHLRDMADHDALTGLLNRRSFDREIEAHVARVKRFGATGAVLMLDLDNFKYYNDTQGHNAGDRLIVKIAHGLRSRLRETDVIARLGGDEFAILLPREDRDGAESAARVLLEHVREHTPPVTLGESRQITASIGIASFADGERLSAEEMMVNADLAMYDAKGRGRDRIAQYRADQHQRPRMQSQVPWATRITDALAHDRFELHAQPIVPLGGKGPEQYELLLRMREANGDVTAPGSFLYIAERLGLIQEIDRWVVAEAIDLLATHRAAGRDLRLEVNLSGYTIGDPALLELIERRLDETAVPPDRLIFEVTETAAVSNVAQATAFAKHLSQLGCRFALDDFGAGFGSFYYLKHLPFDYLKIDGEFVRNCAHNKTDRILISAVVQIARGMHKHTIAEYVEDQETVEVLTRLGVNYGQGFHLGRPAPLATHLSAAGG